jgi:hypothetical protein
MKPELASTHAVIGANFAGSDSTIAGFYPPDSDGAIGPGGFVELLNGVYRVYSQSGEVLQQSSQDEFWFSAGVSPDSEPFDPRVLYDPESGRWFAATITATGFLLAVSNSSDPTQGWQALSIRAIPDGVPQFPDFTALGVNDQGVYLEASNDWYIVAIPKSNLIGGDVTDASATLFTSFADPITPGLPGFVAQPAVASGLAGSEPFLSAANWDQGELRVSSIDWSGSTPTLNAAPDRSITVDPMMIPHDAPQVGSDVPIDTLDPRLTDSVVFQNGELFAVQTVQGSDGRAVLRWYEIADPLGSPQLTASGVISPPGLDAYFGSIAVNPLGQVVVGFSASSPSQYVSSYAVTGTLTGGGIQFDEPMLLASGSAPNTTARWGDFSATTFDPNDPTHFWTIQELPLADNVWRTQITELVFQPAALPGPVVNAPADAQVSANATAAIQGVQVIDDFAAGNPGLMALNVTDAHGLLQMTDEYGNPLPGSGTNATSFAGTLDAVNAALATLTYTADGAGSDSISVNVWDQAGLSTTQQISLEVSQAAGRTKTFNGHGDLMVATNWTPPGVPGPNDFAVMSSGSGILAYSDFGGNTLHFGNDPASPGTPPGPTLDLYEATLNVQSFSSGHGTINASGDSTLNLDPGRHSFEPNAALTVNIGDWDQMNGTLSSPRQGSVTINGSASVYHHDGGTTLSRGDVVHLNTNVLGTGEWKLGFLSNLTVDGLFDETVVAQSGQLDLERPTLFTGQVHLESFGIGGGNPDVVMHDLLATSASYADGLLSLDFGSQLIDQLKLSAPQHFAVYETSRGVEIWGSGIGGAPPDRHTLLLQT